MKIIKSAATAEDLKKINQFTRRELTADEVYVFTVALCDNDVDRDYEKFTVEALKELQPLFIGKPGILDHSMRSEDQNSRVFETWVEQVPVKKTRDGEDLYQLKAKAYILKSEKSAALIDEIDAGIKKEVSVSCNMAVSKCSICGASPRDRCEHMRGQEYDGQLCFFTLEQPEDAYEFSFVAVPAQRGAGVTKSFDLEKGRECRKLEAVFNGFGFVKFAEAEREGIRLIEELSPDALKGAKLNDVLLKDADGKVIGRTKDGSLELKQLGTSLFVNTGAAAIEGDLYISYTGKAKTEFERVDGGVAVYRRTIQSIGKIYTITVDEGTAEKSINSLFDGEIKKAQSERTEALNRKKLEAKKILAKSLIGGKAK